MNQKQKKAKEIIERASHSEGRVQDVLHSVIDDLVEGAMNACREMAFLNGGKKRLGGFLGVYYGGQLYGFEGLDGEAQFEMSEDGTHHRITNIQTLAFKLKPLGEQ